MGFNIPMLKAASLGVCLLLTLEAGQLTAAGLQCLAAAPPPRSELCEPPKPSDYPVQAGPSTCQARFVALALGVSKPKLFPNESADELARLEKSIRSEIEAQARLSKHYCPKNPLLLCPSHADWRQAVRIATSAQFEFVEHSVQSKAELLSRLAELTAWTIPSVPFTVSSIPATRVVGVSVLEIDGQVYPEGHVVAVLGVDLISQKLLVANSWQKADNLPLFQGYVGAVSNITFKHLLIYEIRESGSGLGNASEHSKNRKRSRGATGPPPWTSSEVLQRYNAESKVPKALSRLEDYKTAAAYALSIANAARSPSGTWPAAEEFRIQAKAVAGIDSEAEIAKLLEGALAQAKRSLAFSENVEIAALSKSSFMESASIGRLSDVVLPQSEGNIVRGVLEDSAPLLVLIASQAGKTSNQLAELPEVKKALASKVPDVELPIPLGGDLASGATIPPFFQAVSLAQRLSKLPRNEVVLGQLRTSVEGIETALGAYHAIGEALSADEGTFAERGAETVKAFRLLTPLIPAAQQADFSRALTIADVAVTIASVSSGAGYASAALGLSSSLFGGGGGALGQSDSLGELRAQLKDIENSLREIKVGIDDINDRLTIIEQQLGDIQQQISDTQRLIREEARTVIAEIRGGYANKKNDDWSAFEAAVAASTTPEHDPSILRELRRDRVDATFQVLLNHIEPSIGGLGHPSIAGPDGCFAEVLDAIRARGTEALEEEAQRVAAILHEPNFGGRAYCAAEIMGTLTDSLSKEPVEVWLPDPAAANSLLVPVDSLGVTTFTKAAFPVAAPMSLGYFLAKAEADLGKVIDATHQAQLRERLLAKASGQVRSFGTIAGPYATHLWTEAYRRLNVQVAQDLAELGAPGLGNSLGPVKAWLDEYLRPSFQNKTSFFQFYSSLPHPDARLGVPWEVPTLRPLIKDPGMLDSVFEEKKAARQKSYEKALEWHNAQAKDAGEKFAAAAQAGLKRRIELLNRLLAARDAALKNLSGVSSVGRTLTPETDSIDLPFEYIGSASAPNRTPIAGRTLVRTQFPAWAAEPPAATREVALRVDKAIGRLFDRLVQIGNCFQFVEPASSDYPGDSARERPSEIEAIPEECGKDPRTLDAALIESPKWEKLNENIARFQQAGADAQVKFLSDLEVAVDVYLSGTGSAVSLRQREDSLLRQWLTMRVLERLLEGQSNLGTPTYLKGSQRLAKQLAPLLDKARRSRDPGDLGPGFTLEPVLGRWRLTPSDQPAAVTILKRWQCSLEEPQRECLVWAALDNYYQAPWYRPRAWYGLGERDVGRDSLLETGSSLPEIEFDASQFTLTEEEDSCLLEKNQGCRFDSIPNSGILYATEVFERLRRRSTAIARSGGGRVSAVVGGWSGLASASGYPTRYAGVPFNPYVGGSVGPWLAGVGLAAGPKLHGVGISAIGGFEVRRGLRVLTGWRPAKGKASPHRWLLGVAVDLGRWNGMGH